MSNGRISGWVLSLILCVLCLIKVILLSGQMVVDGIIVWLFHAVSYIFIACYLCFCSIFAFGKVKVKKADFEKVTDEHRREIKKARWFIKLQILQTLSVASLFISSWFTNLTAGHGLDFVDYIFLFNVLYFILVIFIPWHNQKSKTSTT